jgi:cation diffusion facilitator CzcD-associated flavoprotein CzcO
LSYTIGATAIQIVPQLAKVAAEVVVFQRSPNYVTPRNDRLISPWRQAIYRFVPFVRSTYRASLMDIREDYWNVLVDTDSEAHKGVQQVSAQLVENQLPGEERAELRKVLTPNYPPGCKRILISDDYYPALGKPHVLLETAAISNITSTGIQVASGWNSHDSDHPAKEHSVDIIVCATGFKAMQFLSPMHVEVEGQESLIQRWKNGAYAYKGMTVPDLPNFAIMYGPNTNLGHNSIILMIEAQAAYINRLIKAVCTNHTGAPGGYLRLSPKESVTKAWNSKLQTSLAKSTLASDQCSSWYKSADGLITTNWSENVVAYQQEVSTLDWDDYTLEGPGAEKLQAMGQEKWQRVREESQAWALAMFKVSSVGLILAVAAGAAWMSGHRARFSLLR